MSLRHAFPHCLRVSLTLLLLLATITTARSVCKAVLGSSSWPDSAAWASLNETVGGRLLSVVPPGAVCHASQPSFNEAACKEVASKWPDEFFHAADPVSVEWNNFNNDSCLPEPADAATGWGCSGAGYPVYVINATEAAHVKAGVDFAREHKVRLIVKNSGHDYIGRSSGGMSLSIFVHHLSGITVHPSATFTPKGCPATVQIRAIDNSTAPGGIVTALAGTPMLKAYEFAAALNRTVVGGNGRSVALGGFLTGGGHSLLAPRYGLASDLVLEMEVVTPQGEIKTINECSDPELFWAFRGGGGSTFGVLLSATFLTVPTPKVVNVNFALTTLSYNPNAWMGMAHFVSKFPKLADAGVSGYPLLFRDVTVPALPGIPLTIAAGLFIMTDPPGNDGGIAHLRSLLNPLFQEVNATYGSLQAPWFIETNYTTYNSYLDWFRNNWDPTPVGTDQVVTSRLLDEKALTGNLTALAAALRTFTAPNGGQSTVFLVSGKGVHEWQTKVRGAIGSAGTAVVPAWRKTYVHATSTITFPARNLTARAKALQDVESFVSPLRELTPDMGAYMNEANRDEPNWQKAFWGDNYAKLLEIKKRVDPDDVFWCQPCVGNEGWQLIDGVLCKV